MSVETEAAALLRKGAQVIRERGLAKGYYSDEEGRCCGIGALNLVESGDAEIWEATTARMAALSAMRSRHSGTFTGFNDALATSADDVIADMLAAADELDPAGAA